VSGGGPDRIFAICSRCRDRGNRNVQGTAAELFQQYRALDAGLECASGWRMDPKRFVYILRSDTHPERHYVGLTSDVARRLRWHNTGPSGVTVHHRPWSLVVSLEFPDTKNAVRFERYLKSGSGRAFATRHFGACADR
jgi:putative endonuclease